MGAAVSEHRNSVEGAADTARAFIHAVVWGEHHRVWELFAPAGRERVLQAAKRRGMDAVAAGRAREGTWGVEEADVFLTSLVRGLRVDLSGVDIELIDVVDEPEVQPDGAVRLRLESKTLLPAVLTGGANWAAGAVIVGREPDGWRVRSLEPRPPAGS